MVLMESSLETTEWATNELTRYIFPFLISCAALRPDLEILPDGDCTEIGERGISLSGKQDLV